MEKCFIFLNYPTALSNTWQHLSNEYKYNEHYCTVQI